MVMASGFASKRSAKTPIVAYGQHTVTNHGETAMLVQSRNLPVTPDPEIAKVVRSAESIRLGDSDKFTNKALPEVKTVQLGVQLGVGY